MTDLPTQHLLFTCSCTVVDRVSVVQMLLDPQDSRKHLQKLHSCPVFDQVFGDLIIVQQYIHRFQPQVVDVCVWLLSCTQTKLSVRACTSLTGSLALQQGIRMKSCDLETYHVAAPSEPHYRCLLQHQQKAVKAMQL